MTALRDWDPIPTGPNPTLDELATEFLASAEARLRETFPGTQPEATPDPRCVHCAGSGVVQRDAFGNWERCEHCESRDEDRQR